MKLISEVEMSTVNRVKAKTGVPQQLIIPPFQVKQNSKEVNPLRADRKKKGDRPCLWKWVVGQKTPALL